MARARLPEIHVYRNGQSVSRVVWRYADGEEVDMTPQLVGCVTRKITPHASPTVEVEFIATLVEHQQEEEQLPI